MGSHFLLSIESIERQKEDRKKTQRDEKKSVFDEKKLSLKELIERHILFFEKTYPIQIPQDSFPL